eukprot:CAMPEP_0179152496 /NCGR_PEP_ID=MMETSP0796-20121207/74105_1 /TAXON_ID=73915 /ORGANISM="Pyrodinium bahamense, Strain pbaha01" /LENGTH=114 /DNA_ID=CAMNT_0020853699 /DNA_START=304 /DNA_END=646 /DNA_ORIENTATION=-
MQDLTCPSEVQLSVETSGNAMVPLLMPMFVTSEYPLLLQPVPCTLSIAPSSYNVAAQLLSTSWLATMAEKNRVAHSLRIGKMDSLPSFISNTPTACATPGRGPQQLALLCQGVT